MKTLVDHYRDYCNEMKFFDILHMLQKGGSMRDTSEVLGVPYARTRVYWTRISEYDRLCNLQNNPDSIVNLDITYKDFKLLESMRIKTSKVDFSKKLLGNCRLALDEYDN